MNTPYFLNLIVGNIFGSQTTPAIPETYYIGLSMTDPVTEVTEPAANTGYTRIPITALSAPVDGAVHNTADLAFPKTTADIGVVTHYVVYDALTDGNLLFYNALSKSRTLESDVVLAFLAGELDLSIENKAE